MLSYAGKRVVVSGCHSGIGEAVARLLVELGAEVHGLDRSAPTAPLAGFTQFDLGDPASIEMAVAQLDGRVDCLFNCAGVAPGLPALDIVRVNFLGTRHLTECVLPLMTQGGSIVSVASIGGLAWSQRLAASLELIGTRSFEDGVSWVESRRPAIHDGYAFSKETLIVWTMACASAFIRRGVRINCTLPGTTQTAMMDAVEAVTPSEMIELSTQPINRRAAPVEQANALVFLNSDAASYVNGAALPVDGGFLAAVAAAALPAPSGDRA